MNKKILIIVTIGLFLGLVVTSSISAVKNTSNYTTGPPWIGIVRPWQGHLYVGDEEIAKIVLFTVIIGEITIETDTYDYGLSAYSGSGKVEFYIDGVLKHTHPKYEACSWTWDERAFGFHRIKVWAEVPGYEEGGGESITVFIINL